MTPKQFKKMRGDYTLTELSELIGVTTRTIRRYEDGTRSIGKPVQILMELVQSGTLGIKNNDVKTELLLALEGLVNRYPDSAEYEAAYKAIAKARGG